MIGNAGGKLWLAAAIAASGLAAAQPAPKTPKTPKTPAPAPKAPAPKKVDIKAAIHDLAGTDVESAARAADGLGASDQPGAHDALLDALAWGMPAPVAVAAITALGEHAAPPDVDALRRYASHHNPTVRSAALGALAMYPAPTARAAVILGLHDDTGSVRAAAAAAAARGHVRDAVEPLMALLARGEEPAARALAALADADLARKLGDELGKVPDATLAKCLGFILKRQDLADAVRVDVVHAIAKIADPAAVTALTDYIDATPKNPPRQSREQAEKVVEARLGGAK